MTKAKKIKINVNIGIKPNYGLDTNKYKVFFSNFGFYVYGGVDIFQLLLLTTRR